MTEQPEVICGAQAAYCFCGRPPGHEGAHVCADDNTCNGSWTGTYGEESFNVLTWPT